MDEIFSQSIFFGVFISLLGYEVGIFLRKKFKRDIFNPLLISIIFVIGTLLLLDVSYESYNNGAKFISYLLTPATVCLAIPLYQQINLLKKNWKAIIGGILSGVLTSMFSVLLLSMLYGLNHEQYVTLLPKSITMAIGIELSHEFNGIAAITATSIIITGIFGNIIAQSICKLFKIKESVAKGVGIGTSSHAIGTTKAMEMGQEEGAMSSLAIAVAGLFTVVMMSVFANII